MSLSPASKSLLNFRPLHFVPSVERATALVFEDLKSRASLERIELISPSSADVLITGETGTGKELIARHLHALSSLSSGPLVTTVSCWNATQCLTF